MSDESTENEKLLDDSLPPVEDVKRRFYRDRLTYVAVFAITIIAAATRAGQSEQDDVVVTIVTALGAFTMLK